MKERLKTLLFTLILTCFSYSVFAQSISVSDTLRGWQPSWTLNFNGSQAAYDNWSQGGVSSISGTGSTVLTLKYREGSFAYGFRTTLKYGQSNIKGEGVRKTDDLIQIQNRFTYQFNEGGVLSAYGDIGFRTQFDAGYDFDTNQRISDFMAPAYFTEGIGLAYSPIESFTAEAGIGLKQTIVKIDALTTLYGLSPGKNSMYEGGFTTGITYEKEVFEDIFYSGSVATFTNIKIAFDKTDVFWANEIKGKINNKISASFQFELRYDDDFSSDVQVKQVLSAGISFNLM